MISKIEVGSLAEELELKAGDKILEVNGQKPLDIIDLSFFMAEEEIELSARNLNRRSSTAFGVAKTGACFVSSI